MSGRALHDAAAGDSRPVANDACRPDRHREKSPSLVAIGAVRWCLSQGTEVFCCAAQAVLHDGHDWARSLNSARF